VLFARKFACVLRVHIRIESPPPPHLNNNFIIRCVPTTLPGGRGHRVFPPRGSRRRRGLLRRRRP